MSIVTDVLTGGVNNHETTSEAVNGIATDFIAQGIVDTVANTSGVAPATGGYAVNAQGTPAMAVDVSAGVAYVDGTPSTQGAQTFRVKNSATEEVTISANSSGSTKYDWLYITLNATNLNAPNTAGDNVATLTTSRSSSASTDDGTPPTYGYAIAVITVANGATSITDAMIRDTRTQAAVSAGASSAASTWTDTGYAPGTVTYNGNRSYQLVFSNTDLTGFLSNGMRLKLTRTTAPPTQCTDLEASSSQYWSKTSPAGTTFTDDFCAGAWIRLESYTGSEQTIISRYNGTSGWKLEINSDGTVEFIGINAGAANFSRVLSYQSIPLNKWVHIAAQLDMSTFTATSTTSYIMIDGVSVPCAVSRGGTNPTALVQAGNLEVGSTNGAGFFDGKIAQAWYSNAKITQSTIQTYISQGMSGSETSIVSHFDFNGDGNDNNANANNLTASGGAGFATDSPFNSTEYGIITANSFSTDTTLTVQVPEGCAIPTSGGVSAVAYSTQDVPYGFPADRGRWSVEMYLGAGGNNTTGTTAGTTYTFGGSTTNGINLNVPVGAWLLQAVLGTQFTPNASYPDYYIALSTSNSAFDADLNSLGTRMVTNHANTSNPSIIQHHFQSPITTTAATPYYVLGRSVTNFTNFSLRGTASTTAVERTVIRAIPAYV